MPPLSHDEEQVQRQKQSAGGHKTKQGGLGTLPRSVSQAFPSITVNHSGTLQPYAMDSIPGPTFRDSDLSPPGWRER